jgi:3-deoxy-D-manno-octulosonic-acid transferase
VAASTHRGEEAMALEAHRDVAAIHRDALLIIAPRHPERGDDIAALLDGTTHPWARRADGPPPDSASVYLADTLGELGLWYRLAEAAFVGGSTRGVGGHNPYEPIVLDSPVLHGPDTGNFKAIYEELDANDAARLVTTPQELAAGVIALSGTKEGREMTLRAGRLAGGGADALDRALGAIADRLPHD